LSSLTDYLWVFIIGGAICTVAQILISKTRMTSARILVLFVTLGVILTGLGLYEPLVRLAGAGATVPLTGFGFVLGKGAIEGALEEGIFGAFTGGVKAAAGGIAAAIFFGYLASVIFTPKTKK
jgi:stage V sporulation protein AE